ncbi:alpha/beta-hydrolase [Aspergillus eucalypticola CBS 122712]|uniref:Alpha/beta-hydrolase n=1 Tax=Aspergillus eucalypticola (strain CBS 122712 / IBT 29274) TaxID=1448314 RepID=A0A317UVC3_ASPEC|nr:alpha/beta-hydrolase [Aspergillus eucalypticola CBS 122712]PWY65401.1 alpha/beta-hydrolase [Aspergillus eucalypticola CBS 122712]
MVTSTTSPSTTERLKAKHLDLPFFKPKSLSTHPLYKDFGIEFLPGECKLLPAGHLKAPGRKMMQVDTMLEYDVAVPMRDNIKVYVDIFRPANSEQEPVPAIMAWSPYGKRGSPWNLDMLPFRLGVHLDETSGYEAWEAPDPADWCKRGYAVVNCDSRGAGNSEGTQFWWGTQDAEDIYDTIDFLSKQPWCNGAVTMAGNSYLAKCQLTYASRFTHPACKCIAPWESLTDVYRELFHRGGMLTNMDFYPGLIEAACGNQETENMYEYSRNHEFFDDYWNDKAERVEDIDTPMYIVASYSNPFHVNGSFDTFRRAGTKQKWLRVHNSFEWWDLYQKRTNDDLQRFYDRFCKGIMNGWEHDTPPLRLTLLGMNTLPDIVDRPEKEYPLARQQLKKLYLDASKKTLVPLQPPVTAKTAHESHSLDASSDFIFKFTEYTEIAGYSKVRLWVSCNEKDDLDVVVQICKIDKAGNLLMQRTFPAPVVDSEIPFTNHLKVTGSQGFLRASHQVSRDEKRTSPDGQQIFYTHDRAEKITPGSIVPLDITIWPMGMVFQGGEGIKLRISGHSMNGLAFKVAQVPDDVNVGQHVVHTGGPYDSHLIVPIISGPRP